MPLPRKPISPPVKVEGAHCAACGGDILHTGDTYWDNRQEHDDGTLGEPYGWLSDWECAKCGNYVCGNESVRFDWEGGAYFGVIALCVTCRYQAPCEDGHYEGDQVCPGIWDSCWRD